jgi:hypothetical protein
MRYDGEVLTREVEDVVVIPRGDKDIVIKVKSVDNEEDFHKLCPVPTPPERILPGGERQLNVEAPAHKEAVQKYAQKRLAWITIQSLKATPNLEWDQVKDDDPESWLKYTDELSETFSNVEINEIMDRIFAVCGLSPERIEKATQDFLLTTRQEQKD